MTSLLAGSFYTPVRGGHAPGDLREAFRDALDAYEQWDEGEPEPCVELREQQVPISKVFGLLWNCNDIMPALLWQWVRDLDRDGEVKRCTYGAASRWLKGQIEA